MESTEYEDISSLSTTHAPFQTEPMKAAVVKYFSWVLLLHRWESKKPLLHDTRDKNVYTLEPVGATAKLQMHKECLDYAKELGDSTHRPLLPSV